MRRDCCSHVGIKLNWHFIWGKEISKLYWNMTRVRLHFSWYKTVHFSLFVFTFLSFTHGPSFYFLLCSWRMLTCWFFLVMNCFSLVVCFHFSFYIFVLFFSFLFYVFYLFFSWKNEALIPDHARATEIICRTSFCAKHRISVDG